MLCDINNMIIYVSVRMISFYTLSLYSVISYILVLSLEVEWYNVFPLELTVVISVIGFHFSFTVVVTFH